MCTLLILIKSYPPSSLAQYSVSVFLDKVRLSPGSPGPAPPVEPQGGLAVDLGPPEQLLLAGSYVLPSPGLEAGGLQSSPEGER